LIRIPLAVLGLAFGLAAVSASAAAPAATVRIGAIAARLWYNNSGTLSGNLLAGKEPFVGWNTVIGEGAAGEPATDLMVDVTMLGNRSEEQSVDEPLEIWVTEKAGKIIARRKFDYMLVPQQGALHNTLWLQDVGCAGKLTFHARFRKQIKTASLALDCGE